MEMSLVRRPGSSGSDNYIFSFDQQNTTIECETSAASLKSALRSPEMITFTLPNERIVLDFLLERIDNLTTPSYMGPKMSILYSALPIAIASPAMKNAMMACGFALLSQISWGEDSSMQARSYQGKALNVLAGSLHHGSEEGILATILLLHLFEVGFR